MGRTEINGGSLAISALSTALARVESALLMGARVAVILVRENIQGK